MQDGTSPAESSIHNPATSHDILFWVVLGKQIYFTYQVPWGDEKRKNS